MIAEKTNGAGIGSVKRNFGQNERKTGYGAIC